MDILGSRTKEDKIRWELQARSFRLLTLYENSKTIFNSITEVNFTEYRESNRTTARKGGGEEERSFENVRHLIIPFHFTAAFRGTRPRKLYNDRSSRQDLDDAIMQRHLHVHWFAGPINYPIPDRHRRIGRSEFLSSVRNRWDGKLFFRDLCRIRSCTFYVQLYNCRRGWNFIDFIGNTARIVSGIGAYTSSSNRRDVKTRNGKRALNLGAHDTARGKRTKFFRLIGKRDSYARARDKRMRFWIFFPLLSHQPIPLDEPDPTFQIFGGFSHCGPHRERGYDGRKEKNPLTSAYEEEVHTLSGEISVPVRAHRDDAQDRSLPVFIRATSVWSVRQHLTESDISATSTP